MIVTSKTQIDRLRDAFIAGNYTKCKIAEVLGLERKTVRKYFYEFGLIEKLYPEKLADYSFRLPRPSTEKQETDKQKQLLRSLPALVDNFKGGRIVQDKLWLNYKLMYPEGLSLHQFERCHRAWRQAHGVCMYAHRRVKTINDQEMTVLNTWRNSDNLYYWKRATVILGSYNGRTVPEMVAQIESITKTVLRYIDLFKLKGIAGLKIAPYTVEAKRLEGVKRKQGLLIQIHHQTPILHGFNRTSWKYEDLAAAFVTLHKEPMSRAGARELMVKAGYGFTKSRAVLTSPDKYFREKVAHIKQVLSGLAPDEKVFSVDEFGHFGVKIIGGRTIGKKDERVAIPELQKSKGFLIMTAALELSTNQMTHFYSRTKDTEEMIKLLLLLSEQYRDQKRLYIIWDAVSWHCSKLLKLKIAELNSAAYRQENHTPIIELAPLPTSAQFLNVIESVFSGLAKAVLHNSAYESVEACMLAIDRHFLERNAHFKLNPKKAGKKIWGEEVVPAEFAETNNCKTNKRASKIKKESYYGSQQD